MAKKEHHIITRLKKLRPVFNAIFSRTTSTKHAMGIMSISIASIVQEAQTIQTGLRHLEESHLDSQQLSDEFAHLVTFAINLPSTIQYDVGYWSYALDLVDPEKFEEGAEAVNLEQIELLSAALNRIVVVKQAYRDKALQAGLLDE